MFDNFITHDYIIPTELQREETNVDRKDTTMDSVQKSISIIKVINDQPYTPTLFPGSFGVLTKNQKNQENS